MTLISASNHPSPAAAGTMRWRYQSQSLGLEEEGSLLDLLLCFDLLLWFPSWISAPVKGHEPQHQVEGRRRTFLGQSIFHTGSVIQGFLGFLGSWRLFAPEPG
ncbi:hypothetical protein C4D60_Mb11t22460 [Musa balbisiana]|uniref:Uncharacterized protein n=1 Tax=Musa balbisiana TaxID=52838 RepID=A0A4V4H5Q6_MUSBA|nr:hypothetical protein C4D60_Mb11t22460 [Musa balbisiana]